MSPFDLELDVTALQDLSAAAPTPSAAEAQLLPCSGITCWFWTCFSTCKITDA